MHGKKKTQHLIYTAALSAAVLLLIHNHPHIFTASDSAPPHLRKSKSKMGSNSPPSLAVSCKDAADCSFFLLFPNNHLSDSHIWSLDGLRTAEELRLVLRYYSDIYISIYIVDTPFLAFQVRSAIDLISPPLMTQGCLKT